MLPGGWPGCSSALGLLPVHKYHLPGSKRSHPAWVWVSVVLHAVVVVLFVLHSGPTFRPRTVALVELPPIYDEQRQVDLPPLGAGSRGLPGVAIARPAPPARPLPAEAALAPVPVGPQPVIDPDRAPDLRGLFPGAVQGPAYGDGRLWVRPLDALAAASGGEGDGTGEGEEGFDVARHVARVDSAVADRLGRYLAAMPRDSFAMAPPPSWTTEIDGQTWGMDGSWIYLGGLRLPTAILALLPIPQMGNYDQNQRAAQLQRMREDLLQAASRAESAEEFRRYVNELRQRKDREREERMRQMERDTIIP